MYLWAYGGYFNVCSKGDKQCILVTIDASEDGHKKLVGSLDGYRERERSDRELFLEPKHRRLKVSPRPSWRWTMGCWNFGRPCGELYGPVRQVALLGAQLWLIS